MPLKTEIRIGRFLSHTGLCSRRNAKDFLERNDVFFDSKKITDLNFKIPESKLNMPIVVGREKYYWKAKKEIILLNKPSGYICSHREYKNQRSVMRLLPPEKRKFFLAGRLDFMSRGLVVFSNNGEIIHKLMHPSFKIEKVYHVKIHSPLKKDEINKTLNGIYDEGALLKFDKIRLIQKEKKEYAVTLHGGKKREIRRIMKHFSRIVLDIKRVRLGNFKLNDLKEGEIMTILLHGILLCSNIM